MTICSYLVYPNPGELDAMIAALNAIPGCEAYPADQGEMAILVTEADSENANKALQEHLEAIPTMSGLAMVFGQTELQV